MAQDTKDWKMLDCGKYPSEKNCRLKLIAPAEQLDDLIDAGVAHAVKSHGYEDNPDLRKNLRKMAEDVREPAETEMAGA